MLGQTGYIGTLPGTPGYMDDLPIYNLPTIVIGHCKQTINDSMIASSKVLRVLG